MKGNDHYVYAGIRHLFDRFVLVDLKEETYQYLFDTSPQFDGIPSSGSYNDLADFIVSLMINEEDRKNIRPMLTVESLQACLVNDYDNIRYGYHVNRETAQWENLNIICLERENNIAVKVLFTKQDVTELHEKELQKQLYMERQIRAQLDANNAKSQFFSRMSHDIRTPLNAIMGMTSVAMMHLDDIDRVQDCLHKIQVSSQYLLGLVNSVLDMSAIENNKIGLEEKPFNLKKMAEDMISIMSIQVRQKNLKTNVEISPFSHEEVIGDKQRLEQIIINIVGNAIKFTPAGGCVELRVQELDSMLAGYACYQVVCRDYGIGMSQEDVEKIFEPFHRAKNLAREKIEGTGLGMPIAYSLAKLMHGDIKVESVLGEGSTFTLTFYMKYQTSEQKKASKECAVTSESVTPVRGQYQDKRILVVDDNNMNLEIAKEFLLLLNVEIDTAEDGGEALKKILGHGENYYNLILMDIQMPKMSGYEVTRMIRQSGRSDLGKVPIIAMTANAFVDDVKAAADAGMNDHVAKPIAMEEFLDCVEKWL